jgi:hypothetical protein
VEVRSFGLDPASKSAVSCRRKSNPMGLAVFRARQALGAIRRARAFLAVLLTFVTTSLAGAAEPHPINIWYRTVDGCPESEEFVAHLKARGVAAKVARVGDAVDFVVTLGKAENASEGLLERQTQQRAVAIRRLEGEDCKQVAEALALSLVLVMNPESVAPTSEPDATPVPEPAPTVAPPAVVQASADADRSSEPVEASDSAGGAIGLGGAVTTGIASSPMFGGRAFGEIEASALAPIPRAVARVAAEASFASGESAGTDFDVWIIAARLEGCPIRLGSPTLSLRPCLAYEGGVLGTRGGGANGTHNRAFWSAFAVLGRVAWYLSRSLRVEAEAGTNFPLTRYELLAGDPTRVAYDMPPVGVTAALNTAFRLP